MAADLKIRRYAPNDLRAVVTLFTETVRHVNARDYTPEQIAAWAPHDPDESRWNKRLNRGRTLLATSDAGILGFIQLLDDGHLDLLYVHHQHLRTGIARSLLAAAVAEARAAGVTRLHAEASVTARPFFEAHGFLLEQEQAVQLRGVAFVNFSMSRTL